MRSSAVQNHLEEGSCSLGQMWLSPWLLCHELGNPQFRSLLCHAPLNVLRPATVFCLQDGYSKNYLARLYEDYDKGL